ncbi:TIGR04222 domain-containing membrane protein [Chitinimonas arctica]|nr:TIGR04222 domain-containing membrane protein [Chitinimonas arctica]
MRTEQGAMSAMQQSLYRRIQHHPLDRADHAQPFSAKLAQQNGWSAAYARRVVEEYRRFVLLAIASGHIASPSDAVDQAWHLHLCDSRDYWEIFCPNVLRQSLHHEPSRGGASQDRQYQLLYQQTLASYERLFGEAAPADIWPPAPVSSRFIRLDTKRHWYMRRPELPGLRAGALAGAAGSLLLTACATLADIQGPDFLAGYLAALVVWALLAWRWPRLSGRWDRSAEARLPPSLDCYQTAYLAGGERRVLDTGLLRLAQYEQVSMSSTGMVHSLPSAGQGGRHAFERELLRGIGKAKHYLRLSNAGRVAMRSIRQSLEQQKLLFDTVGRARRDMPVLITGALLWSLGAAKLYLGVSHERPIGFLLATLTVFSAMWLFYLWRRGRGLAHTELGRQLLQLKQRHRPTRADSREQTADGFALVGSSALDGTAWAHMPIGSLPTGHGGVSGGTGSSCSTNSSGSGSSCTGSDSGGGSDGGGGGCGGCGGGGD